MTIFRTLALFVATIALATSCDKCGDEAGKTDTGGDGEAAAIQEFDAGSIHTEKITPEVLLPVIQAIGYRGVVPRRVTIQFSRNLIDDGPRAAGADTLFRIEPEVPGSLRFTSNSTLEFTPTTGFEPGQKYTVTLESVDSKKGAMIPPQPWTHEFTTPEFAFIGLSGAYLDEKTGQVELDMRFSAPIDPSKLAEFAEWTHNGDTIWSVQYAPGNEPHIARVILRSSFFEQGGTLAVELDDDFPTADGEHVAEEGEASVEIESGKPVNLYAATRKEGPDGYYIEVVCRDEAAPGGYRYYYDRSTYDSYRISRRCLPDEESKDLITFNPPVDFRIASGEGGFNILGDFKRGNYAMKIESGLRTIDGGVVRRPFDKEVTIPSRTPDITFVNKGRYLPKNRWKKLAVQHLNVDEVEVTIRHIPKRNAIFWMSGDDENADARTSIVVAKERVKFTSKTDQRTTSFIDVARLIDKPKAGVYEVTAAGLGKQDSVRLVPTDLNLVVKRSASKPDAKWADEALVWALDMKTLKPESGVHIDVIRPSGDTLASCDTDETGGCKLSIPVDTVDPSPPFALVATRGDDFTFLKYSNLKTQAPDAAVAGEPYLAEAAYHAAVWSDRGVYRPGETAHLVGVLRTDDYFAPTGNVPVEMELKDPRQKLLTRKVVKTNDAGVVTLDQKFADFATTGFYTLRLTVAKKEVARYRFNVEEFVPERMRVNAKTPAKDYAMGEEITVDASAEYLFGGSAEGSNVELTCRVRPSEFQPEKNADYHYGPASTEPRAMDLPVVTSTITADGTAQLSCPALDAAANFQRPGELEATVAVFEAGSGRTTTAMAKANVHPEPFYIGLKSGTEKVKEGEPVKVEGIVVDWNGEPYTGLDEVEVQFMRLEREYWWYYDDEEGESNYGKNIRPVVEGTTKVKIDKDGKFTVNGKPGQNSEGWIVAAVAQNSRTELRFEGTKRRYYWQRNESSYRTEETPRPSRPTSVVIDAPDSIEVQKTANFQFEIPFSGRLLITTETHEVLTHEWHDVKAGTFDWEFTLADFAPNVYVSALLVKDPHADSEKMFMPDRAYGVKSIRVEPTDKLHQVELTAPEEVRPNSPMEITIDLGPQETESWATVAAVDEGILSLTRFRTPDPSKQLFARRALGVDTFETVGWALGDSPGGPSSRTGGGWDEDGEFGEGPGRVMPVKPVALWSGLVKVPKSGKTTVKFDIPRYRGALRVMAVTADRAHTGSADTRVYVREPIVMQTTLPRFLSAGDEMHIPVFVTNMTGGKETITVRMETSEAETPGLTSNMSSPIIEMLGRREKTVTVPDGKSETVVFGVRGLRQAGTAKFKVTAESEAYSTWDEGVVPFRPNGPHERRTEIVTLSSGKNDLSPHLQGWVPTSEKTNIWVTAVPYGEAFSHLKYLVRYPYGCVEQTTSSTRPLLYVSYLVGQIDPSLVTEGGGIEKMVMHGINRVLSMQTPSGGFAYWPGGTRPNSWGTAYATHMLLDAKEAGFDVPQDRLDEALSWIEDVVNRRSAGSGYGYLYAEPYLHYILARTGKGQAAKIQRLIDQIPAEPNNRQMEKEYLLKTALYLAGDRRYEEYLRDPDTSAIDDERETRWSYYSDARRRAFMLTLFQDMFGADDDGEELLKLVAKNLTKHEESRYYTTQEIMWGVTGLGKWVSKKAARFGDAKLVLNGKRPKPSRTTKGRDDRSWFVYRASEYDDVAIELSGKKGKVYAVISSEGVRQGAEAKTGGNGLSITREYRDAEGNAIEPTGHELGDLVYTELTLTNTSGEALHNQALVDRFPAGFEIENPRLGRGAIPDWVDEDDLWQPEHMEIRDDRLEVFGSLDKGATVKIVYAVRATSAGEYFSPPTHVEGMYDPEHWATAEPSIVTVRGPWDALID
jgi:uncharacterized protein YfaS (alpha-2-macroglobulin family)